MTINAQELALGVTSDLEAEFEGNITEDLEVIINNTDETKGMLQTISNIATIAQLIWSISIYVLAKYDPDIAESSIISAAAKKYKDQTVTSMDKLNVIITAVVSKLTR